MAAEERALAVVAPIIDELELELVDFVYAGGRLKVTIDHPDGLGTELLTRATRMISHELDESDPINGTYTLEVTSPGVERPLRLPAHYERSIGEQVSIKLKPGDDDVRRIKGELAAVDETSISVITSEGEQSVEYDRIAKAKTVFDWGPTPKPGGPGSSKAPKKQSTGSPTGSSKG